MDNETKCPICGKPTAHIYGKYNKYGLCNEHSRQQKNGEIEQCPDCGKWNRTGEECDCHKPAAESKSDELTCIICGKPSNGKHFCYECYKRYKNKEILIKIIKCEFPTGEPLDESYEGIYECNDGHIVKSTFEQQIDNWLHDNDIQHGYETPVNVGTEKPLRPDFYLKNYLGEKKDVYIEYFGLKGNPKYDEETRYKIELYKKKKLTVICLYPNPDGRNINFALQSKLIDDKNKIKVNQINYEQK